MARLSVKFKNTLPHTSKISLLNILYYLICERTDMFKNYELRAVNYFLYNETRYNVLLRFRGVGRLTPAKLN